MLQAKVMRATNGQIIKFCCGDPELSFNLYQFTNNLNIEKAVCKQKLNYLINQKYMITSDIELLESDLMYLKSMPLIKRLIRPIERRAINQKRKAIKDKRKKNNEIKKEIFNANKEMREIDNEKYNDKIMNALGELGFETKNIMIKENDDKTKTITIDYKFYGNEQELNKIILKKIKILQYQINAEVEKYIQENAKKEEATI